MKFHDLPNLLSVERLEDKKLIDALDELRLGHDLEAHNAAHHFPAIKVGTDAIYIRSCYYNNQSTLNA